MSVVWEMSKERCAGRPLARWTRMYTVARISSVAGYVAQFGCAGIFVEEEKGVRWVLLGQ